MKCATSECPKQLKILYCDSFLFENPRSTWHSQCLPCFWSKSKDAITNQNLLQKKACIQESKILRFYPLSHMTLKSSHQEAINSIIILYNTRWLGSGPHLLALVLMHIDDDRMSPSTCSCSLNIKDIHCLWCRSHDLNLLLVFFHCLCLL